MFLMEWSEYSYDSDGHRNLSERNPKRRRLNTPLDSPYPFSPTSALDTHMEQSNKDAIHIDRDEIWNGESQGYAEEHNKQETLGWINEERCCQYFDQGMAAHGLDCCNTSSRSILSSSESKPMSVEHSNTIPHEGNTMEDVSVPAGISRKSGQRTVCFGMIIGVKAEIRGLSCISPLTTLPVCLVSAKAFTLRGQPEAQGHIHYSYYQPLKALMEEDDIEIQIFCTIDEQQKSLTKNNVYAQLTDCRLSIIIYGPDELFEGIGNFFQHHGLFLQDPLGCDRNVVYRNPHRLSSTDPARCPFTFELDQPQPQDHLGDVQIVDDILEALNTESNLKEAEEPSGLRTELSPHQRQALTFLKRREHGWTFEPDEMELWETFPTPYGTCYINSVTQTCQSQPPAQFYGGIVADPMGLGKTLSMISLVLSTLEHENETTRSLHPQSVHATLVVVPPSLLDTWEEQLSEHVVPQTLRWRQHHNRKRLLADANVNDYDIVLTTYHTISAEWKNADGQHKSILFTTRWQRIILDEAHWIRNGKSQMARAVCELEAHSRWAVTGTPFQNKPNDLASLLRFLRVEPYSLPKVFDSDIIQLWKNGEAVEAIHRLKRLLRCVLLRRPKSRVTLPPKHDKECGLVFSAEEVELYEEIRVNALRTLDEGLLNGSAAPKAYFNVLGQINTLRMLCNLGTHYHAKARLRSRSLSHDWTEEAQETFNSLLEIGNLSCQDCGINTEEYATYSQSRPDEYIYLSSCLRIVCSACLKKASASPGFQCGHEPPCSLAPVTFSGTPFDGDIAASGPLPTKVVAVVSQLKSLENGIKSVVFSYWTSTLDLVEHGLKQASINYVRLDGQMSLKQRQITIHRFRTEPSARVMLLTLGCGAVGLNLTVASHAYLIEPHWNPTVEEQALARIHRIGQTKEVTTVRFFMRNSWEENVIKIKESKKTIADLLLAPHNESQADAVVEKLQRLRSFL